MHSLWIDLQNGASVNKIAKKHNVDHSSIAWQLRHDNQHRYKEIMNNRRKQKTVWKKRIPDALFKELANRLQNGEPSTRLSNEYKINRKTIPRRLPKIIGQRKYRKIMDARRSHGIRIPLAQLKRVKKDLEKGQTLTGLAKEYNIGLTTLRRRLPQIMGLEEYKRTVRRIPPIGFGSPEAKKQGADSKLELEIKLLLEKHGIHFEFHKMIIIENHWYIADFVSGKTIIEVAGLTLTSYWIRYKKKIHDYLEIGYKPVVITPTHIQEIAHKYLPKHRVKLIKYNDFKNNTAQILKRIFSTTD